MCQSSDMRDVRTGTPVFENPERPAVGTVRAGPSSPPETTRIAPPCARAIVQVFDSEGPSDEPVVADLEADMSPVSAPQSRSADLERQQRLWDLYRSMPIPLVARPGEGVQKAPKWRAETLPWHFSGYGSRNPALRAVPHSSFGPGLAGAR